MKNKTILDNVKIYFDEISGDSERVSKQPSLAWLRIGRVVKCTACDEMLQ